MNLIFHETLDEFVIIYIDDILVYFKFAKEHVTHLKFVLQLFFLKKLYTNWVKSKFASLEINFLGQVLSQEGVKPNPKKIESIKEWLNLVSTKGIRSFIGLANLYKKFIKDFLTLVKLLTDLLK
jgi:type III secretory pathway component EscU